jgi:hypothetical protein
VFLFLKNVRRIELYTKASIGAPPELLVAAALDVPAGQALPQQQILAFMREQQSGSGKGTMYQRLAQTPEQQLPLTCTVVDVKISSRTGLPEGSDREGAMERTEADSGDIETAGTRTVVTQSSWLVVNQLAGGSARMMAVEAHRRGKTDARGWVPWVGVAAPIQPQRALQVRSLIDGNDWLASLCNPIVKRWHPSMCSRQTCTHIHRRTAVPSVSCRCPCSLAYQCTSMAHSSSLQTAATFGMEQAWRELGSRGHNGMQCF